MPTKPFDPRDDATIKSETGLSETQSFVAHYYAASVAAASTNGIHAAVTDNGSEQTITTGITNPGVPRTLSALPGGTAGDIGAIQVTINGTNAAGETIQEVLPAFTVDTASAVAGSKAFKTVTSIVIPAHDGTGATTSIGFLNGLGINHKLAQNTVLFAFKGGTKEGSAPTVTTSTSALESNTVTLSNALDGSDVDFYYIVDGDE